MQDDPLTPLETAFRSAVQVCLKTRDETARRKTPFARWSASVRAAWASARALAVEQDAKHAQLSRAGRAKRTGK